jgi:hypothetical protein
MPIEFGIILGAPTIWSTMIMTNKLHSCVDPYLDSFAQSFAAANYARATLTGYLLIIRKLGRIMDAEGVDPSALTPDLADRLGRMVPRKKVGTVRLPRPRRIWATGKRWSCFPAFGNMESGGRDACLRP